jgi:hypothetical protein
MRPALLHEATRPRPWGDDRGALLCGIGKAVAVFLATRLVVWTAAYCGATVHVRIQGRVEPPIGRQAEELRAELARADSTLARVFRRRLSGFAPLMNWDAGHYNSIITRGYAYAPASPGGPQEASEANIAFFPLYPLLCRVFAPVTGVAGAQVLVANVAGLLAAMLLYVWVRQRADESAALFAVACTFCWPAACFYSFGYAEGLALLLIVTAGWLVDNGRFVAAGIVGGLATATRPTVLGLVLVIALAYWLRTKGSGVRRWSGAVGLGLLASSGLVFYACYLTYRFGSPLVYVANFQAGWLGPDAAIDWGAFLSFARLWDQFKYFGRIVVGFPAGLVNLANPLAWNMPATLAVLFLSVAGMRRVPRSFRPLLLLGPLIFLQRYLAAGWTNLGVEPLARYTAVAAPAFIVLGAWCAREWSSGARVVLITTLSLLQASWAFHFGLGEWTG